MQPSQPSPIEMFLPFIFIFVIFYFLIIRPQSKKLKTHEVFLKNMRKGDQVVTNSGIFGRVDDLNEQTVTLEISKGIKVKILRKQIASAAPAESIG